MQPATARVTRTIVEWEPTKDDIVVGKDVLELLSSSMYVDPITIFREYVQNAADSVDEARQLGVLHRNQRGLVEISLDPAHRAIRIRDNGTGVPSDDFERRLLSFGASSKRGTASRGFRGVGRLAGLGYCQELIFRCREQGEGFVSELRWDCRTLKSALRDDRHVGDLSDLARSVTQVRRLKETSLPERFFEVELRGVVRHRNDRLLNQSAIQAYLAQVAPVPFASDFAFGEEIAEVISRHTSSANLDIEISGLSGPITRPHSNRIQFSEQIVDTPKDVEFYEVPGTDGGLAAVGWVIHHGYIGAIPPQALIKGLRLRCGDIQVGEGSILEDLFAEPRFNSWAIGEIHVLDQRIIPNGRRDHFEQNVHFDNLLNHLAPVARDISKRCRSSSIERRLVREFRLREAAALEQLGIARQSALGAARTTKLLSEVHRTIAEMEKLAEKLRLTQSNSPDFKVTLEGLRNKLQKLAKGKYRSAFSRLPKKKREIYEQFFGLVYECSTNRAAAKALVDRMVHRLL
jgi:hypothetical protein